MEALNTLSVLHHSQQQGLHQISLIAFSIASEPQHITTTGTLGTLLKCEFIPVYSKVSTSMVVHSIQCSNKLL